MSGLVLLAAVAGGTALLSLLDEESSLAARICGGAALGVALLGLLGFLYALVLGLTPVTVVVASLTLAAPIIPVLRRWRRAGPIPSRHWTRGFSWAVVALVLWAVFDRVLLEPSGGIATGNDHNLGDLPFHLAIVTSFAQGGNLPPEHPELSGVRLTYPFLADFVAAMLVKAGASLRLALLLENLVLALALAGLLYRFGLRSTRDSRAAALTPIIVFLSGGLGFWLFFAEGGDLLVRLFRLKHDYTITWTGELRWGNTLVTLLVPQRSLLLGAPLTLLVWTLWWRALAGDAEPGRARRLMLAAGIVTGLLPLAHAHALVACLGMGACLAVLFPAGHAWATYFVIAGGLALPQLLWVAVGSSVRAGEFLGWQVGWDRGERNVLWFWITNAGLFIPLLVIALLRRRPARLVRFTSPFLLLFVLPNLVRLSPWIWDNVKLLWFWFVASTPLVALLLARLWRGGWARRASAVVLAAGLTLSGALDVWRMASGQIENRIFDAEAVAFAPLVSRATPPRALILHLPTYDSLVYLTGRRSLLGYLGHISSQGLDPGEREAVIQRIYAGASDAEELLSREGVDYVLAGPLERSRVVVNEAFLARYPVVAALGSHRLHAVRR